TAAWSGSSCAASAPAGRRRSTCRRSSWRRHAAGRGSRTRGRSACARAHPGRAAAMMAARWPAIRGPRPRMNSRMQLTQAKWSLGILFCLLLAAGVSIAGRPAAAARQRGGDEPDVQAWRATVEQQAKRIELLERRLAALTEGAEKARPVGVG